VGIARAMRRAVAICIREWIEEGLQRSTVSLVGANYVRTDCFPFCVSRISKEFKSCSAMPSVVLHKFHIFN
jgi:hypothetical protein